MAKPQGSADPPKQRGWTRRRLFRDGSAAAAATMAAGSLAGRAFAAPVTADPVLQVHFQINWQQSFNSEAYKLCQQFTDQNFNALHKGVRAIPQGWGGASTVLGQLLGGDPTTPVVVSSCCGDFPIALPMLAKLDPWLQQDNLSRSLWSQGQLLTYQEQDGLYGVPAYTACQPLIYSQSLLDQLGLQYPDPNWDYQAAEKLWRAMIGPSPKVSGGWRYARTIELQPGGFDAYPFMFHGWGQSQGQMDATHSRALFDTPEAIACGEWWYPLVWDKVFINRFGTGYPGGAAAMAAGMVGMYQSAGNALYEAVTHLSGIKWDVVPQPFWPKGRATNVQVDYYGMNGQFKNQELAWELWKFVAASQATNRFLIQTTLSFPNLMSMWDEWQSVVNAAAPATRGKQLQWWADAATKGYGYGQQFWKYQDSQVENIISTWANQVWSKKLSVADGFNEMNKQINAYEAVGAASAASLAKEEAVYSRLTAQAKSAGHAIQVPAPPRAGTGTAATDAAKYVQANKQAGTFTIQGAGGGVSGSNDGCTFACAPWTSTQGTFTARLVSLSAVKATSIATGGKIGLMARGSLGSGSAAAFLDVAVNRGVHYMGRPFDAINISDTGQSPSNQSTGLFGTSFIMKDNTKAAANYLLKPVWLRISVDINKWTAFTSLDGTTWTQVSPQYTIDPVGVWVGLAVTSHNSGHYIQAVFDHVSGFTPDTFVQIGTP